MADPSIGEMDLVRLLDSFTSLCSQLFEAASVAVILQNRGEPKLLAATIPTLHTIEARGDPASAVVISDGVLYEFPLQFDEVAVGRLEVILTAPLSSEDVELGQALAGVLAVAIVHNNAVSEAAAVNKTLQHALISRVAIEQAKGILAERYKLDMDTAFSLLRSHARNTNQRLSDVSAAIVNGQLLLGGTAMASGI